MQLQNVIESFSQIDKIKILCADKLDREFSSVTEILNYENAPKKEIKALRLFTHGQNTSLILRFDDDDYRNVYFSIQGEEEEVLKFLDALDERLSAMSPWYGLLRRGVLIQIVVQLSIQMVVATVGVLVAAKVLTHFQVPVPQSNRGLSLIVIIFGTCGALSMLATIRILKITFPAGVFAIGQGAKRHHNRDILRTAIIVGFVINFAAGIVLLAITLR